jgi:hypothetical protein
MDHEGGYHIGPNYRRYADDVLGYEGERSPSRVHRDDGQDICEAQGSGDMVFVEEGGMDRRCERVAFLLLLYFGRPGGYDDS